MTSDEFEELVGTFEDVFNQKCDLKRFAMLIKAVGYVDVLSVLEYLVIFGTTPPGEGKRDNPYGLIFKITKSPGFIRNHEVRG
jgi:hypothetical protein